MPSYNFLGIPGASSGAASNNSYLLDQIQIKENQLAADGKLSPGDYKLLVGMAQKAANSPGLTSTERDALKVKISGYQSASSKSSISQNSDVTSLNNEVADSMNTATMLRGNDPQRFVQAQADTLAAKLSQLKDSIDTADQSGDTATSASLTNEWNQTLNDYNDTTNALKDIQTYNAKPTGQPSSDYAAYITTNSKGEITGVKVAQQGSVTGYNETKALYGGLPIYGKANTTTNGTKTFKLGTTTYSGSSAGSVDLSTGLTTSAILTAPNQGSAYNDVNATNAQTQGSIADGGWAQGATSSTWYQNNGGGKYTKYINASQKNLNIPDGAYIQLPNSMEQSIAPAVGTTTDWNATPLDSMSPQGQNVTPSTSAAPLSSGTQTLNNKTFNSAGDPVASATPTPSVSRTQAPVARSPVAVGGIAGQALNGATSFLKGLFGKGNSQ